MGKKRQNRVSSVLRSEISRIIITKIKDPRIGFVTITDVEISGDLKEAKIFTSIFGSQKEKEVSLKALNHAIPFIKNQLNSSVEMKFIPALHFILDEGLEKTDRISRVLKDIDINQNDNNY